MSQDLVFVTGGSGHLGFRVLVTALESGYRVRASVRRQEQIATIKATPSVQSYLNNLEFVIVPDISNDNAYDEALVGVTYVIHSASPLAIPSDDYERDIIQPAVKGTVGLLTSAAKIPSIKRIVITSSMVAVVSWEDLVTNESEKVFDDQSSIEPPKGPFGHPFQAYSASKVFALHATKDFVALNHPSFDIINIMPTFIIGKNELITDVKNMTDGTNGFMLTSVLGAKGSPAPGVTVHVNDVAKVEVLALDTKTIKFPSYDQFALSSGGVGGTVYNDAIDIVKKNFPKQVAEGLFPLTGSQPTKKLKINSDRTEKLFGIKLAGYEEQVNSVVQHYIDLAQAA